jgi:hypothetical protein
MRASFEMHGFSRSDCEYLIIDNSKSNIADAYAGYRDLLNRARGIYVILCHQDVVLLDDDRAALDRRLAELDQVDSTWAVAGNAGATPERIFARITDRSGTNQNNGPFPARVMCLDENFLIVRRDTRVSLSRDVGGFHLYGADLCLNANILGFASYVISLHLRNDGTGTMGAAFDACKAAFQSKWGRALRARLMRPTCTTVDLEPDDSARRQLTYLKKHRIKMLLLAPARVLGRLP